MIDILLFAGLWLLGKHLESKGNIMAGICFVGCFTLIYGQFAVFSSLELGSPMNQLAAFAGIAMVGLAALAVKNEWLGDRQAANELFKFGTLALIGINIVILLTSDRDDIRNQINNLQQSQTIIEKNITTSLDDNEFNEYYTCNV